MLLLIYIKVCTNPKSNILINIEDKGKHFFFNKCNFLTESDKKRASSQLNILIKNLKEQSKTVSDLTPETVQAWRKLAAADKDTFTEEFEKLSPEVQNKIKGLPDDIGTVLSPKMFSVGKEIGKTLGDSISDNMRVNGNTLSSTLANAIQTTKLPRWLKDTPMGHMAESLGFKFYARGGFPDTGEMFVAREAGPELVGKIGSRTAVANNDQITTAMTNAMVMALSGMGMDKKQPIQNTVYIGNRKVFDGMNDYIDSENDRYGTNYVHV